MFDSLFIFLFGITRLFSVLCVGDSISDDGYADAVQGELEHCAKVFIHGVKNSKSEPLYNFVSDYESRVDYLVWYAGINDCMSGRNGRNLSKWAESIVDLGRDRKFKVLIVKHHPWSGYESCDERCRRCSRLYNREVDRIVGESNFAFSVDTSLLGNNGFLKKKYDSGDGLHLSNRGKIVLGKLVADTIMRVSK